MDVKREVPLKAELTVHGGRVLALQELMASELLEKQSRNTLLRVFGQISE
ncbi:hypothetical protein AB0C15_05220 [Micromonospora sp. NPDC048835]